MDVMGESSRKHKVIDQRIPTEIGIQYNDMRAKRSNYAILHYDILERVRQIQEKRLIAGAVMTKAK